jgi:hypothetical protein
MSSHRPNDFWHEGKNHIVLATLARPCGIILMPQGKPSPPHKGRFFSPWGGEPLPRSSARTGRCGGSSLHNILSFQQLTCPSWPHGTGQEAKRGRSKASQGVFLEGRPHPASPAPQGRGPSRPPLAFSLSHSPSAMGERIQQPLWRIRC